MFNYINYNINKYFGLDFNSFLRTTRYQKEMMYDVVVETIKKEEEQRAIIEKNLDKDIRYGE